MAERNLELFNQMMAAFEGGKNNDLAALIAKARNVEETKPADTTDVSQSKAVEAPDVPEPKPAVVAQEQQQSQEQQQEALEDTAIEDVTKPKFVTARPKRTVTGDIGSLFSTASLRIKRFGL